MKNIFPIPIKFLFYKSQHMFCVTDPKVYNHNGLLPLQMQSGTFQSQFSSSQVVGTAGGVRPGGGND